MIKKICVCMSTYNGLKYFDEQINSILNQSYSDFHIYIRDDGSTDKKFLELLKFYNLNNSNITVFFEKNIGLSNSFYNLLIKCSDDCDYIFFSDQDDIWYNNRIDSTLKIINNRKTDIPLLCSCRLEFISEDGTKISNEKGKKFLGINNALVQNLSGGLVTCINKSAREMILKYKPQHSIIYDWWFYLVISATGAVELDTNICVKYRQHSDNVIGGTSSFLELTKKRLKRDIAKELHSIFKQVQEFFDFYESFVLPKNQIIIKNFLKLKHNRVSCFFALFNFKMFRREGFLDNLLFRLLFLFNKF